MATDLSIHGMTDLAWKTKDAFRVLESTAALGVAVVGGDLWADVDPKLRPAYLNWCCDINYGESWPDYVRRSCEYGAEYLASQPGETWFTLVVSEKPDAKQLAKSYDR